MTSSVTLAQNILAAVRADAAVLAFCATAFGAGVVPATYVGIDVEDPPTISPTTPWIVAAPTDAGPASPENYYEHSIDVGLVLMKTGRTTASSVTTLDGFPLIEQFARVVHNAVRAQTVVAAGLLSSTPMRYEINYPYFKGSATYRIAEAL